MIDLAKYADMKICVAVSGGRDSMALLHYLYTHAREYAIVLSALNCDHRMRASSAGDTAFVKSWCAERNIPLQCYEWDTQGPKTETAARRWRLECYRQAIEGGAGKVATAHHLNDNAETVLFNLARGSSLSGLSGISDNGFLIRPLINCTRSEIEEYIKNNSVPYVDDETNFTDCYTRNKIRHNVLPELERAVPEAAQAIYRLSRLAAEDEQYFDALIKPLIKQTGCGVAIAHCGEKVVFRRAVVKVIKEFGKKDYTLDHAERLYSLQFCENGKKFEFLGLTAYKEEGRIVICADTQTTEEQIPFESYCGDAVFGQKFIICGRCETQSGKVLKFDRESIPPTAVIRVMRGGDRFTKFGGGTKSLGNYFTDKKIPLRLRNKIPLIADGSNVLAVGGIEISDTIKLKENTKKITYLICTDYTALK